MKRFYVTAAIAASLLATSCQKTYVVDEVNTPIGFEANLGKQTKAIVNGATLPDAGTFGVFCYALTDGSSWSDSSPLTNKVMNNVQIGKDGDTWRATGDIKYYWPNNADTKLNFFAYYPYQAVAETSTDPNQETLGQIPGVDKNGITLTNYVHDNIYVDFMTADAKDRTYEKPDGASATSATKGTVKLQFTHQLTQLVFAVKKAADYSGITMTLQSITLNNIGNTATFENGTWAAPTISTGTYTIDFTEANMTLTTDAENSKGKGMTVIPQSLTASTESASGQTMTIVYKIKGTGVAEETVTKTVDLYTENLKKWDPNQKITYNISIGMQEILFNPSVSTWTTPESSAEVPIN